MSLLDELKKLKPELPETECFVPEWNRAIKLRGFTVLEGRKLRQGLSGDSEQDNEKLAMKTIAHAVAYGDERPLANKDGIELIEGLSELTVRKLMMAFARVSTGEDAEKNSGPTVVENGSSTDSLSPSAEPSANSKKASARLN
jgi:hypothetical protein